MDNTYIFFTADHGLSVGHHGLIGKQNMYDHSVRVPMIVAGPEIPKGKKSGKELYLQDIMPTSLAMAGIEQPDYVDFKSFLDLAKGGADRVHYPEIYGAYVKSQRMIRKDGYKLIVYPNAPKVLLFDLEKDPDEITDLAENAEQSDKVQSLFADLQKLQTQMEDELDLQPSFDAWKSASE